MINIETINLEHGSVRERKTGFDLIFIRNPKKKERKAECKM
jgi:hypothetical protein